MFKKIIEFFNGKSAEKGLAYTDKFAEQAPYKVEPPVKTETPAASVPAAVNDQITDSVTQAKPEEKKPAAKKTAKPKKPAEPKKSAPAKKPKKASK